MPELRRERDVLACAELGLRAMEHAPGFVAAVSRVLPALTLWPEVASALYVHAFDNDRAARRAFVRRLANRAQRQGVA